VFNNLTVSLPGVVKRREIAKRLGMSVAAVTATRKRLERKVKEYKFQTALMRIGRNGVATRPERNGNGGWRSGKALNSNHG